LVGGVHHTAAFVAGRGAWFSTSAIRHARHEHSGIERPVWTQRVMGAQVARLWRN
jgi:hypothetical protein